MLWLYLTATTIYGLSLSPPQRSFGRRPSTRRPVVRRGRTPCAGHQVGHAGTWGHQGRRTRSRTGPQPREGPPGSCCLPAAAGRSTVARPSRSPREPPARATSTCVRVGCPLGTRRCTAPWPLPKTGLLGHQGPPSPPGTAPPAERTAAAPSPV